MPSVSRRTRSTRCYIFKLAHHQKPRKAKAASFPTGGPRRESEQAERAAWRHNFWRGLILRRSWPTMAREPASSQRESEAVIRWSGKNSSASFVISRKSAAPATSIARSATRTLVCASRKTASTTVWTAGKRATTRPRIRCRKRPRRRGGAAQAWGLNLRRTSPLWRPRALGAWAPKEFRSDIPLLALRRTSRERRGNRERADGLPEEAKH